MNVIARPTVKLVASTSFYRHPKYHVPYDGDSATQLGAFAAKGCYDAYGVDGRSNKENQARIIASGHGSVLEHYNISLFIEGISRACSHEIVRHRAGFAYSQRSTRYTDETEASIVLDPYYASLDSHDPLLIHHLDTCEGAIEAYGWEVEQLIARNPRGLKSKTELRKWARGKARNLLPHALETRMTMTGNLRAWRHFIETRSEQHAEAEIRRLSNHVFQVLLTEARQYFEDYEPLLVDGLNAYITAYKKV